MPKSGERHIFELIKHLSKAEKRYCTLFLKRSAAGNESGLPILFAAIDKMDSFDEDELLATVPKLNRRTLPNAKRRLYERLLQALRMFYAGDNAAVAIREYLQSAEILYRKGLYDSCWKLLEKCKSLAYDNELIHMLPEIINWQKRRLVLRIRTNNTRSAYRTMMEEEQRVNKMLANTIAAEELGTRMYALFIRSGRVLRSADLAAELHRELLPLQERYDKGDAGFWESVHINTALYHYFQLTGQFEHALSLSLKQLDLFRQKEFISRDEPVQFLYVLNRCIISQIVLGKYSDAEQMLQQLRALGDDTGSRNGAPSLVAVFETANFLELEMHIRRGRFDQAFSLVSSMMPELRAYDKSMHNVNVYSKYYRIALALFGEGRFAESLNWVLDGCNAGESVSRLDIYLSLRMLHLLIQYELEEFSALEYLAESYRREFKRLDRLHASEAAMLRFFRRADHYWLHGELTRELRKLLSEMSAIRAQEPLERFAFAYFNVCDWIRSKIEGRSYASLIAAKERLESDVSPSGRPPRFR